MEYSFHTTKTNAKRRGKPFDLTFEEFKLYAVKTDYITSKGRHKEGFSIDCVENEKGYVIDNIRPLSTSENSRKGTMVLVYDWQTGKGYYEKREKRIPQPDDYF